jgi:hypothetical protein
MKVAIVTTTIHVPEVIALHHEFYPDAVYFISGDAKTPNREIREFLKAIPNCYYYSPEDQKALDYQCSDLLGWNTVQRRNIALLEAMKYDVDIIIVIDDDNIPVNKDHIPLMIDLISNPFSGLQVSSENNWIDTGRFLQPRVIMRGVPFCKKDAGYTYSSVIQKKIGIVAGLSIGDPDINAAEWLVNPPFVTNAHETLNPVLLLDKNSFAPFNSQNTAYCKELFPLAFVIPFIGKYNDIWSSYIAEKILRQFDYSVAFGRPFSFQARNKHNYIQDLKIELLGIEYTENFCQILNDIDLNMSDVTSCLRQIFTSLKGYNFFPNEAVEAGLAWCSDVSNILQSQ